jgi:hypothetical protein
MSALLSSLRHFLVTKEAAHFLGVSPRTLEKHRSYGTGPKWSKVGGRILYAVHDLQGWVKVGAKRSTTEPVGTTLLPAMLSTSEAARFLKVCVRTLERHRVYGTGPNYSKIGRRIFYAFSDVTEWAERGAKRSTSEPAIVLPARPVDELHSGTDSAPAASCFEASKPDTIASNNFPPAPASAELSRSV